MATKNSGKVGLDVSRNMDVKSSYIKDAVGKKYIPDDASTAKFDTLITASITSKQNGNCLKLADEILTAFPKKDWEKTVLFLDVQEVVLDGAGKDVVWYRDFTASMTLKALSDKVTAYRLIQSTIEGFKSGAVIIHRSTKDGNSKTSTAKTPATKPAVAGWLPAKKSPAKKSPAPAPVEVIQ